MGGMNGFSTALNAAGQLANLTSGARNTYSNYRDVTASYDQAKSKYDQSEQDIAEKEALEKQRLQLDNEEAARTRKSALKRAVASQQAAFGGQGIDTTDGSGEAVLLGLFQESSEEKAYRDRLDQLKRASLDQDTTAKRRRNLLALQNNYENARDGFIRNLDSYI
jgi:hypothetical protein